MRRKRRREEEENVDRWAISYADFITLMFTFFAALYSLTSIDKGKMETFSTSLKEVFQVIESPITDTDKEKESTLQMLEKAFEGKKGISVKRDSRGVVVTISSPLLFSPGSAHITDQGKPVLDRIMKILKKSAAPVIIEGHTDRMDKPGVKFTSNWDFSTARAASMLYGFISQGLRPNRFQIAGYAGYRPVASGKTEEGRSRNRRMEIVIRQ